MQRAMFQCLLGIQTRDFVMIAADKTNTQSIMILSSDVDKILPISDKLFMGVTGDLGDISQFSQFIIKNSALYKIKNGYELGINAAVHFTRKNLADSLRSGTPFVVNILIGGYDEETKTTSMHFLDTMATCVKIPFAAHGFGGMFAISILDYYYKPTMTEAEAYNVMAMCVREIHNRLFMNLPNFQVKVVNKTGVTVLPMLCPATFYTQAPAGTTAVYTEEDNGYDGEGEQAKFQ